MGDVGDGGDLIEGPGSPTGGHVWVLDRDGREGREMFPGVGDRIEDRGRIDESAGVGEGTELHASVAGGRGVLVAVDVGALPAKLVERLDEHGIRAGKIDARTVRFVTHKDVDDHDLDRTITALDTIHKEDT